MRDKYTSVSVYVLKEPCGLVRYVGATSDLARRLRQHKREAYHGSMQQGTTYFYPVNHWVRSLLDADNEPRWRIVDEVAPEHRRDAERFWVMLYRHKDANLLNEREPTGNAIAHAIRLGLLPALPEEWAS